LNIPTENQKPYIKDGQDNAMADRTKKTQAMVNKILYRKRLFEQKHKQWSTKYYTENDYLSKKSLKIPKG